VDETGTAASLIPVPPNTIRARPGIFAYNGEPMTTISGYVVTAQVGTFPFAGQSATLIPPAAAYTGPGEVTGWGTAYGYWGLRAYNASKIGANCIDVCSNVNGTPASPFTIKIGSNGYLDESTLPGYSPIYVNRIYDQAGAQDLFFNSAFERPTLSTTITVGGKPSMRFNGSVWGMSTANATALAQIVNVAAVVRAMTFSSNGRILTDGSVNFQPMTIAGAATVAQYLGVFNDTHTNVADNTFGALVSVCANSAGGIYVNGVNAPATGGVGANGIGTTNKLTVGATDDGGGALNGYIYEILIKGGSISATNIGLLNTNMHTIGTGWT
jgi:hypothetical protein